MNLCSLRTHVFTLTVVYLGVLQCENNGDPPEFKNGQNITYWATCYYMLVTMSTVGYGDISPRTDIGRAFVVVYILGSFVSYHRLIVSGTGSFNVEL
jgi:hypothetical protein